MRLHLPKRLLHAVIASLVTASAALFTLGSAAYAGFVDSGADVNTFYLNGNNAKDFNQTGLTYLTISRDASGNYSNEYGTYVDGKYTLNTNPSGFANNQLINTIAAGEISTATISTLNLPNAKGLIISAGGQRGFTVGDGLIIEDVKIAGENAAATINIAANQIVTLGSVSQGTLNVDFRAGNDNFNRKLQIKNSSTIALGTITNSWGLDAIDIGAGSKLKASTISFKTGNNTGTDGQGGKITGAGTVEVTTFDA